MTVPVSQPLGVCSVEEDTRLLAELGLRTGGKRMLDMGTGTGYVAIYWAQHGVAEVDAVDVSPRALQAAHANAQAAGVKVNVYHSNLFSATTGVYDVIAFNPPMNAAESEFTRWVTSTLRRWNRLARLLMRITEPVRPAARDRFLATFLDEARENLSPNGRLLLVLSPGEIDACERAVPSALVFGRTPIPTLPPLMIAEVGFR